MSIETTKDFQGFSLSSVCWGYRDIFARIIQALFDQRMIGDDNPEVTEAFFGLMKCAEQQHYDYVLKEFLSALNPATTWLLDLPAIFEDVVNLGREFADVKLHYGISYFRLLGEGGLGASPDAVRFALNTAHQLRAVADDLALAFLSGYRYLSSRLTHEEMHIYVKMGLKSYQQNASTGLRFMEGSLKSSEQLIQGLTRESRLSGMRPQMEKLLRALVGYEVEVNDMSYLDSDELLDRGSRMVCLYKWLYVPARVRHFDGATQNRNWYRLLGIIAAGMLAFDSFSRIHGHPAYEQLSDLVPDGVRILNLVQIVEYARVIERIREHWPGAQHLLDVGLSTEYEAAPPRTPDEKLFFELMGYGHSNLDIEFIATLRKVIVTSVNVFDTLRLLDDESLAGLAGTGIGAYPLRPFSFLPDFQYPIRASTPPAEALIADLKNKAHRRNDQGEEEDKSRHNDPQDSDASGEDQNESGRQGSANACYLYDEWSQTEGDYYENHCHLYERIPKPAAHTSILPEELTYLARRTQRIFEMLRPAVQKEKYLRNGDTINTDLLTDYLVALRTQGMPKVNFYEKPYLKRRDLSTVILLDISGSTGSETTRYKTIELEKHAAVILGQGLHTLGDRFAVCGFSGNGREMCEFYIYKGLDDPWDQERQCLVMSAHPRNATRMGPALRHAGYLLEQTGTLQRLIILITDGKPMDTGYDPNTQYAQYDVRMACEENLRKGIHTFCISTDENSRADMDIMFPGNMYAILSDIIKLPSILPVMYVRLTV